jgi:hypothetical protein
MANKQPKDIQEPKNVYVQPEDQPDSPEGQQFIEATIQGDYYTDASGRLPTKKYLVKLKVLQSEIGQHGILSHFKHNPSTYMLEDYPDFVRLHTHILRPTIIDDKESTDASKDEANE